MKKIACIVNPVSGLKKSLKVYYEVENEINSRNFKPILFLSKYAGHVNKIIESLPEDIDRILIFGGDGSINDVLNKLYNNNQLDRYKIGAMPTGSGNSVMHDLKLLNIKNALEVALGNNFKKADLNKIKFDNSNRISVSVLGWGMFSYGNIRAEKLRWLGPIRYDVASIITLLEKRMHRAKITIDNIEKDITCAFIVGCNSVHTGKGMKVAPNGGFFDGEDREDLVFRLKDDYDSATPTPSSVARFEYAVLAEITGKPSYRQVARKSLLSVIDTLRQSPTQLAESLKAVSFMVGKPARIVIAGSQQREEFLEVAWTGQRQNLLVVGTTGPVSEFTRQLKEVKSGKTTVYYCVGQTCRLPETDPAILADWLKEDRSSEKSPAEEAGSQSSPALE